MRYSSHVGQGLGRIVRGRYEKINQQANRNYKRFPQSFRFQLTEEEKAELVANCNRFEMLKHSTTLLYVYTEQGVAMLSAVLHSPEAVEISIRIIEACILKMHLRKERSMRVICKFCIILFPSIVQQESSHLQRCLFY